MRNFLPLLGKELRALFYSPIAYIIIAVFLLLMGYSFTLTLFLNKFATLIHIFFQSAGLLLLLIPIITMRLFAEERKAGTLELLLTAPVRESQVVLAKYLASMAVVLAMIALTGAYGIVLGMFGSPDWGPIYSGYVGLVLLASTLVALGLTISALTSNQVAAAIVTIGISFLMWTIDTLAAMMPEGLERVLISLSLLAHFTPFAAGAMYTSDLGFFVSTTLLALFLAMRALARR
ncbi:MAG TPA: ABC transporter permease subunit [Burkholderiales bacterium]|jgi:ABC-2 type transport system permease protein|nr:ABC transporter permease subunit [Burkholderiales bacterium]